MFKKKAGGLDTVFTRKAREPKGVKSEDSGSSIVTPEERKQRAALEAEERIAQRNAKFAERQTERETQVEELRTNAAEVKEALGNGDLDAAVEINARIPTPKLR